MTVANKAQMMKLDSPKMARTGLRERNDALECVKKALLEHKDEIFAANKEDLEAAKEGNIADSIIKRLKFGEDKLEGVISGIDQLKTLEDPIGKVLLHRQLDKGLELYRVSVPIGVIGVIFEARPDALVQISTLCIKSGNCAVLKGGKETAKTNRCLFNIIYDAAIKAGLPENCLYQVEAHSEIDELLSCDKSVDLLIPRGSNAFVQYIMNNTKIPVMGHADGVCHVYVDKDADIEKALDIITDAKTQYTAACNATETMLVNENIASSFLKRAAERLENAGVKLRGNKKVREYIGCEEMGDDEYRTEYLGLVLSVKIVKDIDEAITHINAFGSHHTDAIVTENKDAAEYFMQMVDSAGVYCNCSTRFADGFRYGFGAEVGISTSKLHARGPVGLEGLVTYKYRLYGDGHIVADYADGNKSFHFKELN
ncbi:MAG: glutamate-5-semialdehyde dehydrogenase [Eubacterium sp.]|nr:glutamate-5-semialdehyde dehydrogenase [Eubacterium sp.]